MSKGWEISMRNRLASAALVALLGMLADVRQPAQAERAVQKSFEPSRLQLADIRGVQLLIGDAEAAKRTGSATSFVRFQTSGRLPKRTDTSRSANW